ncbi:alpha-amylase family glycosyl hydrolase [Verrucomicrobiota bacterium]
MIKNICADELENVRTRLNRLYGPAKADTLTNRFVSLLGRYGIGYGRPQKPERWDEDTTLLITYGDMISEPGERPLQTLKKFVDEKARDAISAIHILPFSPYSSDDGFSVIDYREVDPALGKWKDIAAIGKEYKLMADLVLNHCSRKGPWFKNYAAGVAPFRDYFIEVDPNTDLSAVVRPRSLPLLSEVKTQQGLKHLWTTFSSDQVDLNFKNPDVLFDFLDILLYYISMGARIIRLDAIAYLWKAPGTPCIHLNQTHEVVKLMRSLLNMAAPDTVLLTETNVPHDENISYFGNSDEAHMVYNFSLPPLLLHALLNGTGKYLTRWAVEVSEPPAECTYLNFTASHDGIGVRPLQGLIPEKELTSLVEHVEKLGGQVSTKRNSDGTDSPYELNITYFDALGSPSQSGLNVQIQRFICSQSIAMALKGVPAVYFHSLVGTRNWTEGVEQTGRARTINRRKWDKRELDNLLADSGSVHAQVFHEYERRLRIRRQQPAFHPDATQQVLNFSDEIFAFLRETDRQSILCISNLTDRPQEISIDGHFAAIETTKPYTDLLSGQRYSGAVKQLQLQPYQTLWLTC